MKRQDSGKVVSRVILLFSLSVFMAVLLLASGCIEDVEELQVESHSIEPEGAESADVVLDMISGDMSIAGGSENLIDAEFRYNVASWKPEIEYEVREGWGNLDVRQPEMQGVMSGSGGRNEWDLRLNKEMPIDLKADLENGNIGLAPGDSRLKKLDITVKNGNINAELTGDQPLLEELMIKHSNGNVVLDLTGDFPSVSSVTLDSINGNIDTELSGSYASLNHVEISQKIGNIATDLTGNWSKDADVEVTLNSGKITLKLPRQTGVYVEVVTPTHVEAEGFRREGVAYVNDAYGKSEVTLNIKASSDIGIIELMLAD